MTEATIKIAPMRVSIISLSVDVYEDAQQCGLNLSQTYYQPLCETIRQEKSRRWAVEHADFIDAYNRIMEVEGLPP